MTGTICGNRSKAYRERIKEFGEGVSFITIASAYQFLFFGPSDMKLMSAVTAWLDGMN